MPQAVAVNGATARALRIEAGGTASTDRLPSSGDNVMLGLAVTFLIVALIAAVFGFGGVAGTAAGLAKLAFFVFLVMAVLAFLF